MIFIPSFRGTSWRWITDTSKLLQQLAGQPGGKGWNALPGLIDSFHQFISVNTLKQVSAGAGLHRLKQVTIICGGGQDNNPCLGHLRFNQAGSCQAIASRHTDIHQNHIGFELARQFDRFKPVNGHSSDLKIMGFEQVLQSFQHQLVVIDQEVLSSHFLQIFSDRHIQLHHGALARFRIDFQ